MQEFTNWTVETIRQDKLLGAWMEERKFDWIPLISQTINNILDKNKSVLIITDHENEWFKQYILTHINNKKLSRPYFPFYSLESFYPNVDGVKTENDIQLIHDLLDTSFPNGYFFWYIGKSQSKRATLAKISKHPFLWLMDEELSNSFYLDSNDEALDIRLLNMYRLFNKTLDAALCATVDVNK
jgi:hypothetical protein